MPRQVVKRDSITQRPLHDVAGVYDEDCSPDEQHNRLLLASTHQSQWGCGSSIGFATNVGEVKDQSTTLRGKTKRHTGKQARITLWRTERYCEETTSHGKGANRARERRLEELETCRAIQFEATISQLHVAKATAPYESRFTTPSVRQPGRYQRAERGRFHIVRPIGTKQKVLHGAR